MCLGYADLCLLQDTLAMEIIGDRYLDCVVWEVSPCDHHCLFGLEKAGFSFNLWQDVLQSILN